MPSHTDVVIVGAGAAGLAAAAALRDAGIAFQLIEARSRIGGRAWTDDETFPGLTFDRGCHWLHEAESNPFRGIADRLGFAYDRDYTFDYQAFWQSGNWLDKLQLADVQQQIDTALDFVFAAGKAGQDVAIAELLDPADPLYGYLDLIVGLMSAATPATASARDLALGSDTGQDWPVAKGYGALVARHAKDIPVTLDCPVRRIDWSGPGVRVETDRGTIAARAVIVTASTSVLATGVIDFQPALPVAKAEALAATPVGCAEKVVFRLDRPMDDLPENYTFGIHSPARDDRVPLSFHANSAGQPLMIVHLGGSCLADLIAAGDDAMAEMARAALTDAFGSAFGDRLVGQAVTGWANDPFIRGAYSCALPGKAHLRPLLREPLGDRIFFAGEATSPQSYQTCHGAHQSGQTAAAEVRNVLAV